MIFWQLIYTFATIGIFTFGGGYSMIALIQAQVVDNHGWMTRQEFADLLAVSQMTPGPIGINTATYAGYTAVVNAGYPTWAAVVGSILASLSVVALPVALMMIVGRWLLSHRDEAKVAATMHTMRLAVVGMVAAAALSMVGQETFGSSDVPLQLTVSIIIFGAVFFLSWRKKVSPILLIVASGIMGLLVYSI